MTTLGPVKFTAIGGETQYRNPFPSLPASVTVNGTPASVTQSGAYIVFASALTKDDVVVITATADDSAGMTGDAALNVDSPAVTKLFSVTIANGASLSSAVDLGGFRPFGFIMPAAWTAADVTFQGGPDTSTLNNLYDDTGTEVSAKAAASQMVVFSQPVKWLGVQALKVRSGTSGAVVNQGGARNITIIGVQ